MDSVYTDKSKSHTFLQVSYEICLTVIYLIGLITNVLMIAVILKNKKFYTSTNWYLISLALSYLLIILSDGVILGIEMYENVSFGWVANYIVLIADLMGTVTAICVIVALTVDRYIGTCHPNWARKLQNLSRTAKIIIIIWIFGIIYSTTVVIGSNMMYGREESTFVMFTKFITSVEVVVIVFFIIPVIVIIVVYTLIALNVWRYNKLSDAGPEAEQIFDKKEYTIAIIIVLQFIICWGPSYIFLIIIEIYGTELSETTVIKFFYFSETINMFTTIIDPIIYFYISPEFQRATKDLICCRRSSPSQGVNGPYEFELEYVPRE